MSGTTLLCIIGAGIILALFALKFASGVFKIFLRLFLILLIFFIVWLLVMAFKVGPFIQKM